MLQDIIENDTVALACRKRPASVESVAYHSVELLCYSVCSGLISLNASNFNMSLFPEQRSK